jgi:hypothetical protein
MRSSVGPGPDRSGGFPVLRNFKLGRAVYRAAHHHWISCGANPGVGIRADTAGIESIETAERQQKMSRGRVWIYVIVFGGALSLGVFFLGR